MIAATNEIVLNWFKCNFDPFIFKIVNFLYFYF